jgi:fructose 1,6-bisphosphatase
MKEFLCLPTDPAGYGDFGAAYVGADAKVQFVYRNGAADVVGEIYFPFCLSLLVNGEMDKQREIPYDKVMLAGTGLGFDGAFNKYVVMLSGSDFQFEVLSKKCLFNDNVESDLIEAS